MWAPRSCADTPKRILATIRLSDGCALLKTPQKHLVDISPEMEAFRLLVKAPPLLEGTIPKIAGDQLPFVLISFAIQKL